MKPDAMWDILAFLDIVLSKHSSDELRKCFETHHLCWFQFALNSAWMRGGSGCLKLDENKVDEGAGGLLMIIAVPTETRLQEAKGRNESRILSRRIESCTFSPNQELLLIYITYEALIR
jgi:hypothetical protein